MRIEYENLLRYARLNVSIIEEALPKYEYSPFQKNKEEEDLRMAREDVEYYTKILEGIGAQSDTFKGIDCTTVL